MPGILLRVGLTGIGNLLAVSTTLGLVAFGLNGVSRPMSPEKPIEIAAVLDGGGRFYYLADPLYLLFASLSSRETIAVGILSPPLDYAAAACGETNLLESIGCSLISLL